jgi:DNA repair protein RadC
MQLMIRDLAFAERPRERLLAVGVEGLKDEELLALVLRTGYRGHNAVEVARALLTEYTLPSLLHLPAARLARLRGMGLSRAATLLAAAELIRRSQTQPPAGRVETVNDVMAQSLDIRDKKKEYLLAFFLNARHQLIAKEIISIGTLTASLAHPREIFAPAIGRAAAALILVHNHPSGDPTPSEEDQRLTQRIAQAGRLMGIELLDHLIVAEKGSYSFKNSGGYL